MDAPAAATVRRAVALFVLFRKLRGTIDFRAFLEPRVCLRLYFKCRSAPAAGLSRRLSASKALPAPIGVVSICHVPRP